MSDMPAAEARLGEMALRSSALNAEMRDLALSAFGRAGGGLAATALNAFFAASDGVEDCRKRGVGGGPSVMHIAEMMLRWQEDALATARAILADTTN